MTQREKHLQALESFTNEVKHDPNVIALLLSGSLSYGTVWERSDIDLTLLARDGSITKEAEYCVERDGIEMHVYIMEVSAFKEKMQRLRAGQYPHSYFGKGTMVFSKDEALNAFFEDARKVGSRDAEMSYLGMVGCLLVDMYRAEKWITVFNDTLYSQRFLQKCCTIAADMVLLLNGEEPTRESVLRAMELNPELMRQVYIIPSTTAMPEQDIRRCLEALDGFLRENMEMWSRPIKKLLSDGEAWTVSEMKKFFGMETLSVQLSYLAENGILQRISRSSRVFKNSRLTVEETAYLYIGEEHENV